MVSIKDHPIAFSIIVALLVVFLVSFSGCTSSSGSGSGTSAATPVSGVNPVAPAIPDTTQIPASTVSTDLVTGVPATKTVLYSDSLSQWQAGWDQPYSDESRGGAVFYEGNALHLRDISPPASITCSKFDRNFSDFVLDVDAKVINSSRFYDPADQMSGNWYQVIVRQKDIDNYYSIGIVDWGILNPQYNIVRITNGTPVPINKKDSYTIFINTGKNAANHLTITCNKSRLTLSVNGHVLDTVTDPALSEGSIQLCVNSNNGLFSEGAYSNLSITPI